MTIAISELRPAGSELFMDSESYLNDFTESDSVYGGSTDLVGNYVDFVEILHHSFVKVAALKVLDNAGGFVVDIAMSGGY